MPDQTARPIDPGAAAASQSAAPQPGQMSYSAMDPQSGTNITGTENDIADHLRSKGYNINSVSPDGTQFTQPWAPPMAPASPVAMQRGYTTHNFSDALSHMGLQNVSAQPVHSDQSTVDPDLSAETNQLMTDAKKKDFLQQTLSARGMDNPQVVGSGGVWHAYVPQTKTWQQITETPKFGDRSGWEDLAYKAPETILSGLGATAGGGLGAALGIPSGPGALATGALGAAGGAGLGGAGGQALTQGGLALADPSYRHALETGSASEELGAHGMSALYDAATGPVVAAAGAIPLEKIAQSVGSGVGRLGGLASRAGAALTNPSVAETAANLADPTGAMMLGEALSTPATAVTAAAKAPSWLAGKLPGLSEETQAGMHDLSSNLLKYGDTAEGVGQAYAERSAAKDIAGAAQRAVDQGLAPSSMMSEEEASARQAAGHLADHLGLGAEESSALQDEAAKGLSGGNSNFVNSEELGRQSFGGKTPWQQEAGKAMDELGAAGSLITGTGRGIAQGAGYAVQGAGGLGQLAGKAISASGGPARAYGVPETADLMRDYLLRRHGDKNQKPMLMSP